MDISKGALTAGLVGCFALGIVATSNYYHSHFDPASIRQVTVYRVFQLGNDRVEKTYLVQAADAGDVVTHEATGWSEVERVTWTATACPATKHSGEAGYQISKTGCIGSEY